MVTGDAEGESFYEAVADIYAENALPVTWSWIQIHWQILVPESMGSIAASSTGKRVSAFWPVQHLKETIRCRAR